MDRKTGFFSILAVLLLLVSALPTIPAGKPAVHPRFTVAAAFAPDFPTAIAVSDASPFYALIATPLALHFNERGDRTVIPLYVKDFNNPSSAVQRAEADIGKYADYIVGGASAKRASLAAATLLWNQSNTAVLIPEDAAGYTYGVSIAPLASYLSIPIIVSSAVDSDVIDVLDYLGVQNLYVCGDMSCPGAYTVDRFTSATQILNETRAVLHDRLGATPNYVTLTNPLDVQPPTVLNSTRYEYNASVASVLALPTQLVGMVLHGTGNTYTFTVPEDYKYAILRFDLRNLDSQNVALLGDRMSFMLTGPDNQTIFFAGTAGGIPVRDPEGTLVEDRVHFETVMYDTPGTYTLLVMGNWFAQKMGLYNLKIRVDSVDSPLVPLMSNISSLAPYLTAYHQGVLLANTSYAFAADDNVLVNGSTCPGVTQPGGNYPLGVAANEHTKTIHDSLNNVLATLASIDPNDTQALREHYLADPAYIAIVADPTMIPMYYYHNPDGVAETHNGAMMGLYVPSDFYMADIDPKAADPENDTYSYWPIQENIVGRVTGIDAQDLSALLDRTFFYDTIIAGLGDWKNNSLVQTGCGLEFQNLPVFTKISQLIYSGRGEPTKFPTGESYFINKRLNEDMQQGGFNASSTFWLQSQREGFTPAGLDRIKNTGLLNKLLFPSWIVTLLSSTSKVTGGQEHLRANLIFSFAHGFFNLYEFGDVFIDSRGFPGVTMWSRLYPKVRSSLSDKGAFDLREVENMKYGPSVIFVESCITARTDGLLAENTLSQVYLHSGVNAYIGSTRVTADPGYLDPRPFPNGLGFGILGLLKATILYKFKHQYPDLHFGAVIAENTIIGLIKNDSTVGKALRDSKNAYLALDANSTFLWTPPLTLSTGFPLVDNMLLSGLQPIKQNERTRVLDKKYVALHEFALYGDPAFNPYQPINEGTN
jgi:hypothetical protein